MTRLALALVATVALFACGDDDDDRSLADDQSVSTTATTGKATTTTVEPDSFTVGDRVNVNGGTAKVVA